MQAGDGGRSAGRGQVIAVGRLPWRTTDVESVLDANGRFLFGFLQRFHDEWAGAAYC
jgi:hypothetical protein